MWRRKKNICSYWDCDKRIPDGEFLCAEHKERWINGLIDRCPKCGRFKDVAYQLCLDCYFGRPIKPKKTPAVIPKPKRIHRVEYSDAWTDGHMSPHKHFVFILELDDGVLYVGHAKDLREQLSGYQNSKKLSAAGRHPKLRYAQTVANKESAELREAELKKLIETNPTQIRLMIDDFCAHMRDLGYTEDF